jgi:hypothetical protein
MSERAGLLGPFVAAVTDTSAKIWLHYPAPLRQSVYVTLHESTPAAAPDAVSSIDLTEENLHTGLAAFGSLKPDTRYYYRLWWKDNSSEPMDLEGLEPTDLRFMTLPTNGFDDRLDFLLMSCHDPTKATDDGCNGFAVWQTIPRILQENRNVRFALLLGDQVYGDDIEKAGLAEEGEGKRRELYLSVYRRFWSDVRYRKVLCSVPAVLMWDDHDVTDGWGSRVDSFVDEGSSAFRPEWLRLFRTARAAFARMQASRNPPPLDHAPDAAFDTCFRIGRAGFIVADLRSNRNVREKRLWKQEQLMQIRDWVQANRQSLDTVFFASSVVFSHGAPKIDEVAADHWGVFLRVLAWLAKFSKIGGLIRRLQEEFGDLRDDINDAWGSKPNRAQADEVLDFLFGLQNPEDGHKPMNVVILSGDIHTPGYSTLYSSDPAHAQAVIPHIVSTPVAYKPFTWILEAIYRHLTKTVALGEKGTYSAQVSHHFCHRNIVVVSLRYPAETECQLKVKYYLEGFPEPQMMLFDLNRGSHRENIDWPPNSKPGGMAALSV